MSRAGVQALLDRAGSAPVPTIAPGFAAALEARLTTQIPVPTDAPVIGSRQRVTRSLVIAAAALLVVAAVVAGAAVLRDSPEPPASVTLARAVDTVVELPDGQVVSGRRGLTLPNGAVVRTGPAGRAVVGRVELGPGEEGVVRDGSLRRRTVASTTTIPPATSRPAPTSDAPVETRPPPPRTGPSTVPPETRPTSRRR